MITDRPTIAQIFGVSPDTVRAWMKDGCPSIDPEAPSGTAERRRRKFDTVRVHNWLVQLALKRW